MADFIDAFLIGDGEAILPGFLDAYREYQGEARERLLRRLAAVPGVYVPSLYRTDYDADGIPASVTPVVPEAEALIERQLVTKLPPPPVHPVVPYIEVVHDRGAIEIQRGCSRGCRFCQAGMAYRPVRGRPQQEIIRATGELLAACGYDEVSLVSLNTSDYPGIDRLVAELGRLHPNLSLSLPSLRLDTSSVDLVGSLPTRRRTGLTFAPEAGSERLRRAINKDVTETSLLETATEAFSRGWTGIKLYFMVGLPTETNEDVEDIVRLVEKVRAAGRAASGKKPMVRVSVATFIPKPHTPFQWSAQLDKASLNARHDILQQGLRHKSTRLAWHDPGASLLEAALSRGDRRTGRVIHNAWKGGCKFDAWSELFRFESWRQAFADAGLEPEFYAGRERPLEERLPWAHINTGVSIDFLKAEYRRAYQGLTTPDCRLGNCNACGLENTEVCAGKE
jgi:radical SAM family uncharacterized protein